MNFYYFQQAEIRQLEERDDEKVQQKQKTEEKKELDLVREMNYFVARIFYFIILTFETHKRLLV